MARHLRIEFPGAIYHISCRMVGQWQDGNAFLFKDDSDRLRLLDRLADRVDQYSIRLYLFTLMSNHLHMVFETPEGNCSKFMQSLLTAYTVYYNLRHGRHGHLFDGRYKAKLVDGDEYLLALSRYVHLNPVKTGAMKEAPIEERVRHLRRYRWSTYPSYIGRRKPFDFVDYEPMLGEMGGKRIQRPGRYRQFVEADLAADDEEFKMMLGRSPRSIGGESFRLWVDERYQELLRGHNAPEDASFRRVTEPLPVRVILDTVATALQVDPAAFKQRQRNSPLRAVAARMLCTYGAQTQRQVATHLGLSTGAAISIQLRNLPALVAKDRHLRHTVQTIEKKLSAQRVSSQAEPAPGAEKCR